MNTKRRVILRTISNLLCFLYNILTSNFHLLIEKYFNKDILDYEQRGYVRNKIDTGEMKQG